jgi:hypothetical protein
MERGEGPVGKLVSSDELYVRTDKLLTDDAFPCVLLSSFTLATCPRFVLHLT